MFLEVPAEGCADRVGDSDCADRGRVWLCV